MSKFIYWGGVNSGKTQIERLCVINHKSFLAYGRNQFLVKSTSTPEYTKDTLEDKLNDNRYKDVVVYYVDKETKEVVERKVSMLFNFHKTVIRPNESMHFVRNQTGKELNFRADLHFITHLLGIHIPEDEFLNNYDNSLQSTGQYQDMWIEKYVDPYNLNFYKHILKVLDEVDWVSCPYFLLSPTLKGMSFFKYSFLIDAMKNFTHIIPYKSNIIDSLVSKLNLAHTLKYKNLIEWYNTDVNTLWNAIDCYTNVSRNYERSLQFYNIEYRYFDLDKDRYETLGFKNYQPVSATHPTLDKKTDEYKFLEKLAHEYIENRNFIDSRLIHSNIDRIK